MKKIWILFAVAILAVACNNKSKENLETSQNEDITIISGTIENNSDPFIFITYDSKTDTIKINENGEFTANVLISSPTHITFSNGKYYSNIYTMPKSDISFTADATDFWNTLKFSGNDEVVNNYLALQNKTVQLAGVNNENFLYASDYAVFSFALEELMQVLNSNNNDFIVENGENYPEFIEIEKQRLQMLRGSLVLTFYSPVINSNKTIDAAEKEINNILSSTDLNNPQLVNIHEFKPFVQNLMGYLVYKKIEADKIEITSAEGYAELFFQVIDENFIENAVKEELYYTFLKDFLNYYGPEAVVEIYNTYKDITSNKERLSELDKIFDEFSKLAKGQPSINWTFPDMDGKNYSLSDFKGKYVYIDVWATWCGPCKRETPYLNELKEKFAGKNIEIIQISVDDNREDWVKMVNDKNLGGIQLYASGWDNDLCNHFKINGIPRFILIDMDGNIINSNADRPSGDIETVLNGLEGI